MISTGNQDILNALRLMDAKSATRSAETSKGILEALNLKFIEEKIEFENGKYDSLPCDTGMVACNNAFIDLANKFEDILSTSFEVSPRGDKTRVTTVADNLIKLMANSYYSVTWVNAKYSNRTNPNKIDVNDIRRVEEASQSKILKVYFDKAIKSYETWIINKFFRSCRLCDACGGDYPINGGGGVSLFTWQSYMDKCSGNL